nr:hypothetical protein Iba_scaffold68911CG0010 [Ipomoea batatas]GMD74713.1 hypothetical protein Iba_scaffold301595CG0010 [Ipomoea batatas]GME02011.1 hypothetical protein Iba_scaffold1680243CG0010 [Ipomoea batatas]
MGNLPRDTQVHEFPLSHPFPRTVCCNFSLEWITIIVSSQKSDSLSLWVIAREICCCLGSAIFSWSVTIIGDKSRYPPLLRCISVPVIFADKEQKIRPPIMNFAASSPPGITDCLARILQMPARIFFVVGS